MPIQDQGQSLSGRRVAVLATDGFEQSELEKPVEALKAAGARVEVVSPKTGQIQGMEHDQKGRMVSVDSHSNTPRPAATTRWCCRAGWPTPTNFGWSPRPSTSCAALPRPTSPSRPSVTAPGP